MNQDKSYPMTITPLDAVRSRKDSRGKPYLSFRAHTESGGRAKERTVRIFGDDVATMGPLLHKGVAVAGRVAYDSFVGKDGRHSQSMRIVSIAA